MSGGSPTTTMSWYFAGTACFWRSIRRCTRKRGAARTRCTSPRAATASTGTAHGTASPWFRAVPYYKETDGIWVEILEAPDFKKRETRWETKVPGFTMDDCDRIVTDNLAHTVTWKKNADLSALKGRSVYLRFKMKRAGLFGFQ